MSRPYPPAELWDVVARAETRGLQPKRALDLDELLAALAS
jgi:hypothetical protein